MTEYEWLTCDKPLLMLRRLRERDAATDGDLHHLCLKKLGLSNVVIATESIGHVDKSSCDLIREVVGNPFRDPMWHTMLNGKKELLTIEKDHGLWPALWNSKVIAFAQGIIESNRYHDVPALADLLEEAGCDNEELLRHFRQEVRCPGCFFAHNYHEFIEYHDCKTDGWLPKPVPCQPGCWALRLLTGEAS